MIRKVCRVFGRPPASRFQRETLQLFAAPARLARSPRTAETLDYYVNIAGSRAACRSAMWRCNILEYDRYAERRPTKTAAKSSRIQLNYRRYDAIFVGK